MGLSWRQPVTGCEEGRATKDYKYIIVDSVEDALWFATEILDIPLRATRAGFAPENFVIAVGMGDL